MKCFISIAILFFTKSIDGCTFQEAQFEKSVSQKKDWKFDGWSFGYSFNRNDDLNITTFGSVIPYCNYSYNGTNGMVSFKVRPGSIFNTMDCKTCRCYEYGLTCCGRQPVQAPPGCKVIMDGCEVLTVKESNNQTDCFTGEPANVILRQRQMIQQLIYLKNQNQNPGSAAQTGSNGNGNGNGFGAEEMGEGMSPLIRGMMLSQAMKQMNDKPANPLKQILMLRLFLGGEM